MYNEDDLLLISALQHLAFCPRQWGLMYLEGVWDENVLTVEGGQMHDRADEPGTEVRGDIRIARGLRLRSLRLGLTGKADVVEFHRVPDADEGCAPPDSNRSGVRLDGVPGLWRPLPVEYKHGKPKANHCDEVQLCAQALCLEEMLQVAISFGALFYGKPRRRYEVSLDRALRAETETLAANLHELTRAAVTPPAKYEKKCRSCSLLSFCLPKATSGRSASRYLARALSEIEEEKP